MGLIYGAGLQPLMILVKLPPGALPQAGMKRAFGASSLWKMIACPSGLRPTTLPAVTVAATSPPPLIDPRPFWASTG